VESVKICLPIPTDGKVTAGSTVLYHRRVQVEGIGVDEIRPISRVQVGAREGGRGRGEDNGCRERGERPRPREPCY
jgi:hypothetical protein